MFQRLKGAIDSRILEEQTRLAALSGSSPPTNATRSASSRSTSAVRSSDSPSSRMDSPSKRQARAKLLAEAEKRGVGGDGGRGPDPSDFDSEAGDEADANISRGDLSSPAKVETAGDADGLAERSKDVAVGETEAPLPTDVRVKLRKLEKLEGRYQDLLKSYRLAHARVLSIEPFETALRESTPLTSISDPAALVEYLNQVKLKGDMVMEELKRVTEDRDGKVKRIVVVEQELREEREKVQQLESRSVNGDKAEGAPMDKVIAEDGEPIEDPLTASVILGKTSSTVQSERKSTTESMASRSIKGKADEEGSDFFSYDDEIPRLELELERRTAQVQELKAEVTSLKKDLQFATNSKQGVMKSLEVTTLEIAQLNEDRNRHATEMAFLTKTLNQTREELEKAQERLQDSQGGGSERGEKLEAEKDKLEQEASRLRVIIDGHKDRFNALEQSANDLRLNHSKVEAERASATTQLAIQTKAVIDLEEKIRDQETELRVSNAANMTPPLALTKPAASTVGKGKKKRGKGAFSKPGSASSATTAVAVPASSSITISLKEEIKTLQDSLQEREAQITVLQSKRKLEEELREEVDSLRDNLVEVGQEHVIARERIKTIEAEKATLTSRLQDVEERLAKYEAAQDHSDSRSIPRSNELSAALQEAKEGVKELEVDLLAAQSLAATRYKDLADMREVLQRAQRELATLRTEVISLRGAKEEVTKKTGEVRSLEDKEKALRAEIQELQKKFFEIGSESKSLKNKLSQERDLKIKAEEGRSVAESDLRSVEAERKKAIDAHTTNARELIKSRGEGTTLKARIEELEQQIAKLGTDSRELKEEIDLKSAQYASAESLMGSMRDQTAEMGVQLKEARERCDSLEEELADAHRLLSERSREGETMRRLIGDVDSRAEARVREMRAQLDTAIEERDRAEDEASTSGRRRTREIEDLKIKVRDVERSMKRAELGREELEIAGKEWKQRRVGLESRASEAIKEVEDVRHAMTEIGDALDNSEKQMREVEKQKVDLRKTVEDTQSRLDKLQKSHKVMHEEMKALKTSRAKNAEEVASSRSSIDSSRSRPRLASPARSVAPFKGRPTTMSPTNGATDVSIDYVYLKNVLLQFLEQRDKKHQMQLIPVLGMLLHFDPRDEQRWMAAITTK